MIRGSYTLVCCGTLLCTLWHSCYCVNKLVLLHSKSNLQLSHFFSLPRQLDKNVYFQGKCMWQVQQKVLLQEYLAALQQQLVYKRGRYKPRLTRLMLSTSSQATTVAGHPSCRNCQCLGHCATSHLWCFPQKSHDGWHYFGSSWTSGSGSPKINWPPAATVD